jgi:hypothetical protein
MLRSLEPGDQHAPVDQLLVRSKAAMIAEADPSELQQAVESQHGGRAVLVGAEPVKETFNGATVWEGQVHVFDLEGHPRRPGPMRGRLRLREAATPIYAVLDLGGIRSPLDAVRAAFVAERGAR